MLHGAFEQDHAHPLDVVECVEGLVDGLVCADDEPLEEDDEECALC